MRQSNIRGNLILSNLTAEDCTLIEPHLRPATLRLRQCLEAANREIEAAYFPYRGIVSVVAVSKNRQHQAEVGLIGWEGMTGLSAVLGVGMSPMNVFVQVEGDGQAIRTDKLRALMAQSATLCDTLFRYVQVFAMQAGYTALANARGNINQRLARWLLMAHDRTAGDELHLTHEFLALMLGVRRAGVTIALHELQTTGDISLSRSSIRITDRGRLEKSADGLYGAPEQELERLFTQGQAMKSGGGNKRV
jgi:CRP-like cAMP-binding protein